MIKLYHSIGARSLRCLWALEELKLPYELEMLPFPPRLKAAEYLQVNPAGTLPFLIDGSTRMSESAAILEYLVAKYDSLNLRVSPDEEDFGSWLNWIHFGEATLTTPLASVVRYAVALPKELRLPIVAEDFTGIFLERLTRVEEALADREFLCADRFTIADISVGYALYLGVFLRMGDRFPPAVSGYLERLQKRPAFQAAVGKQMATQA